MGKPLIVAVTKGEVSFSMFYTFDDGQVLYIDAEEPIMTNVIDLAAFGLMLKENDPREEPPYVSGEFAQGEDYCFEGKETTPEDQKELAKYVKALPEAPLLIQDLLRFW